MQDNLLSTDDSPMCAQKFDYLVQERINNVLFADGSIVQALLRG